MKGVRRRVRAAVLLAAAALALSGAAPVGAVGGVYNAPCGPGWTMRCSAHFGPTGGLFCAATDGPHSVDTGVAATGVDCFVAAGESPLCRLQRWMAGYAAFASGPCDLTPQYEICVGAGRVFISGFNTGIQNYACG